MTDTNVHCGPNFFSIPFGISYKWLIVLVLVVSFVVGFIASYCLKKSYRHARLEMIYSTEHFNTRNFWKGLFVILVFFTFVVVPALAVCGIVYSFKGEIDLIHPECVHWAVLVISASLSLICSFLIYFIIQWIASQNAAAIVPVDNENHEMTLSPVQPSVQQHAMQQAQGPAVAHGMTRRSRRSPTRAASALGQQDQEPRAEERPRSQTDGWVRTRRS